MSTAAIRAVLLGSAGVGLYTRNNELNSYAALAGPLPGRLFASLFLAGFGGADASHVLFESTVRLLPEAAAGVDNLYESYDGVLSLAGVLPASEGGGAPPEGSFAGAYNWGARSTETGGAEEGLYTENTISTDGSHVFFTAAGTGQLFVREDGSTTVKVSASHRSVPDPNGERPAAFMAASPSGSAVFFTSCEKLTNGSTAVSTGAPSCTGTEQGQDLYEYDVASGALRDLTVDERVSDPLGAAVQGVLGTGFDSSGSATVYFVANGVLAPGGVPGDCEGSSSYPGGECNLYVEHDGVVKFIAKLSTEEEVHPPSLKDVQNWYPGLLDGIGLERTSRVSQNGEVLLVTSRQKLTTYNNDGFSELYRYARSSGSLTCVSCAPSGTPPTRAATLQSIGTTSQPLPPTSILPRNLTDEGNRVVFETVDGLIPSDTNGLQDVYEWEAPSVGSCGEASEGFSATSGGCLSLISSGVSSQLSYFADASATGDDVFFFTEQQMVEQDADANVDVYDARVDGGIPAQNERPPFPCEGEGCRSAPAAVPGIAAPGSDQRLGEGNLAPVVAKAPAFVSKTPLTRAQKLANALKACKRKHGKRRKSCEATARNHFGKKQAKHTSGKDLHAGGSR